MIAERIDPGYGNPRAPLGSEEWAKNWRLGFQNAVKNLPSTPATCWKFYTAGAEYRAWALVKDAQGNNYREFDRFCADAQPYGLGMDPQRLRAHLEAHAGKRQADLITVSEGEKAGRPKKGEEISPAIGEISSESSKSKAGYLRAILRAPEVVRDLYREGLLTQQVAAKMGPKSPTPDQASHLAEVRQELEGLDRSLPKREFRKRAAAIVGCRQKTAPEWVRHWWQKLTDEERVELLKEFTHA